MTSTGGRSLCSVPAECPRATSWTTASSWGECPWRVGGQWWAACLDLSCCEAIFLPAPSCPGSTEPATSLKASPLLPSRLSHFVYLSLAAPGLGCCTGFSLCQARGAPHCSGFCCGGARVPGCSGFSSCSTWAQYLRLPALEHRLSGCGTRAQLLRGIWDLPRPGVQPALVGASFTTEPSGKPCFFILIILLKFDCAGSSLPCGLFSSCSERGLLFAGASLTADHRLQGAQASRAAAPQRAI